MEQIDLKLSICNNALNISIDIEADNALFVPKSDNRNFKHTNRELE
jgi:hypothetical protein